MKQRLLVAFVGLPLLLVVLLALPAWATMLLVCAIAAVAAYELLHTVGKNVGGAVYGMTILAAIAHELLIFFAPRMENLPVAPLTLLRFAFVVFLFLVAVVRYGKNTMPFSDLCAAVMGGIVFSTMYSSLFLLRADAEFGRVYVLAPFFIAFVGDTLSMFGGMLFGKRKMAPHVSPKKTWAGGIAGPIGSALAMLLLGLIGTAAFDYAPNYAALVFVGWGANLFGQLGDLSMSFIKREVGIKDYSRLFLTHGGVLDRFDSTLFIAPVVYFAVSGGLI